MSLPVFGRHLLMLRLRMAIRLCITISLLPACFGVSSDAQDELPAVQKVEHRWGFNGKIQNGQFNPLSILLDNPSSVPIEATVKLQKIEGLLQRVGAPLTEDVYLAPASRRWVQFYPYIAKASPQSNEWLLTIGEQSISIGEAGSVDRIPQIVFLKRPGDISTTGAVVTFPTEIFPPYGLATHGLHAVFLDHVPDWEEPRQQAFMTWLRRGGQVHILKNPAGQQLRFSGPLADLNQPLPEFTVGAGTVTKHEFGRSGVTKDSYPVIVGLVPQGKNPDQELNDAMQAQQAGLQQFDPNQWMNEPSAFDDRTFEKLRATTQPEHAWAVIFLLALLYIGLIFPGCWLLGFRRRTHYLVTYGSILGVCGLFCLLFFFIGRRGYGESVQVTTLSAAHTTGDGTWDVMQWGSLFVTGGGQYRVETKDEIALFTTASHREAVDGEISSGKDGHMEVRIPPFSAHTFLARRELSMPECRIDVMSMTVGRDRLEELSVGLSESLRSDGASGFVAIHGEYVYPLHWNEQASKLSLAGDSRLLSVELARSQNTGEDYYPGYSMFGFYRNEDPEQLRENFFRDARFMLTARMFQDDLPSETKDVVLPPQVVRIVGYVKMPDALRLAVTDDPTQDGWVLLMHDVDVDSADGQ